MHINATIPPIVRRDYFYNSKFGFVQLIKRETATPYDVAVPLRECLLSE